VTQSVVPNQTTFWQSGEPTASVATEGTPPIAEDIPRDWYTRIFDERYLEVDQLRKPAPTTAGEIGWLMRHVVRSKRAHILDLCCGYGRHSIRLAQHGHDVEGLDLSAPLLHAARLKAAEADVRLTLHHCDMRDIQPSAFDVVLSMHTSFGYLPEGQDDAEVLRAVHGCLVPGGSLVLQFLDPDCAIRAGSIEERLVLKDGTQYRKVSRVVDNGEYAYWYGVYAYQSRDGSSVIYPFGIRLYKPSALVSMATRVGFHGCTIGRSTSAPDGNIPAGTLALRARKRGR